MYEYPSNSYPVLIRIKQMVTIRCLYHLLLAIHWDGSHSKKMNDFCCRIIRVTDLWVDALCMYEASARSQFHIWCEREIKTGLKNISHEFASPARFYLFMALVCVENFMKYNLNNNGLWVAPKL